MKVKVTRKVFVAIAAATLASAGSARASMFDANHLAVERMNGTASSATAVLVDEYAKSGFQVSPVQSIPLPTAPSGSNLILTDSGSASSDGQMTRSYDGQYLVIGGYNSAVGTAGVASSDPSTTVRVVGLIDASGTVDTSRSFNNGPLANFRSVTGDLNTGQIYASTQGAQSPTATPGILLAGGSGPGSGVLNGNTQGVSIYGGHVFVSSAKAVPGIGILDLGSEPTNLVSSPTLVPYPVAGSGSVSPEQFVLMDLNAAVGFDGTDADTIYLADDRSIANANSGGLQKWVYNGTIWSLAYTITAGLPAAGAGGLRGLAGELVAGVPTLYATNAGISSGGTQGNSLFALIDDGTGSSAFTKLADSPTNTFFRGVALAPIPEPASLGLLAVAGLLIQRNRRGRA